MRRRSAFVLPLAFVLVTCSGGGLGSVAPSGSAADTPSSAPSEVASPSAAPTKLPGCWPACVEPQLTRPGPLDAGTYRTRYFFGGQLEITLGDGFTGHEDSTGELAFFRGEHDWSELIVWLDIYPIVDPSKTPVAGVDPTAAGMLAWLKSNPNVVLSEPLDVELGGLPAKLVEVSTAPDAVNVDPGCPQELRPCVGLFGHPQWESWYGAGSPFVGAFYVADVMWDSTPHLLVVWADSQGPDSLELYQEFAPVAQQAIGTLILPPDVVAGGPG